MKHTRSPKSYGEEFRHPSSDRIINPTLPLNSAKKPSTAKKKSNSKPKLEKKNTTVQKAGSGNLKKGKKKLPIVE